jgi:hypothetical protein
MVLRWRIDHFSGGVPERGAGQVADTLFVRLKDSLHRSKMIDGEQAGLADLLPPDG